MSVKTIQRWDKAGLLPVVRTATNQRRIPVDAIHHVLNAPGKSLRCAIYARVSSATQEQASGLNEKRKGLKRLLHLIEQQEIDLVLIEDPDRLVGFGYGYLEETFRWKQVSIEVVEPPKT